MPRRVVTDLLRLIRVRAALVSPRIVVVIAPQRLEEKLKEAGLPANVETGHFGAVAGIDRWASAAGLICIGRSQPGPLIVEPLAGVVTGTVPEALPEAETGSTWFPRVAGGVRLASGDVAAVDQLRHPDPVAEALRWQITEAGLIQAIGRLRALRRGPEAPAFLDIINDVPLPISVDEAPAWDEAKIGAWGEMATEGVLLSSVADIEACFPEVAPTRKTARECSFPTLALTSLCKLDIDVRANVRRASYKRLGRFAPAACVLLPNAPADLKSWLADRIGAIEWVRIEEPEAPKAAEPQPAPVSAAPRWPCCADLAPELAAAYRLVAEREAVPFRPVPVIPEIVRWRPPPRLRVVSGAAFREAAE